MIINLPKLIGHRGVRDLFPENTIQSINKAIELSLKWVEVDVKISQDLIPFLLHDATLERTTSGNGNPLNYRYSELCKLDAGSWFDRKYKNLYLPTLKEVLNLCSQKNIGVNIELKPNKGFEEANAVAISDLIKKYNLDKKRQIIEEKKLSKQIELDEKKRAREEKKLAKQIEIDEKKRVREEKKLAKQNEIERKRKIKKGKKLNKQPDLQKKTIYQAKSKSEKNVIKIDTNIGTLKINLNKFEDFVDKITKRNSLRSYPDINDIPN